MPNTIGLVTQGDEHLGHPLQGRRQVDHLVPDQGLRGQGLHGPQDVGRADRPVRQDRRRRHQPVVRQRRRPRRRDRLADHRLGRGSRPQDQGRSTTTTTGSATRSRSRTRASRMPSTSTSARSSSRPSTSSAATRRSSPPTRRRPWIRCSPTIWRTRSAGCRRSRPGTARTSSRISGPAAQPSKYVIGDGRRDLPVPDHRPGPELCRGLGRHAHGARRPARSSCRRRVPRHAAGPPEVDRRRQRHLDQLHHPRRLVCRRLQAQGRFRDRERREGHRLRRFRPHAAARSAPEPSGPRRSSGPTTVAPTPTRF